MRPLVCAVMVCAACAHCGCGVLSSRRGSHHCETSAVASCVVILWSQAAFHKTDFYGKGKLVYANTIDGRGIYDMYKLRDGTSIGLIDRSLADAYPLSGRPKKRPRTTSSGSVLNSGS